jgi:hypothetical protein
MNKIDRLEKILDVVKAQEELGMAKAKSIIGDVRRRADDLPEIPIPDFFKKEEVVVEEKKKFNWGLLIAVIVGVLVVAAIVYGLYCYFTPDYLEDFEDDFEDEEFDDDDFFEDDDK